MSKPLKAEDLAALSVEDIGAFLRSLSTTEVTHLLYDWGFWSRDSQLEPGKDHLSVPWSCWMILAGRGFGKTRTGAEWVRKIVCGDTPLAAGECRHLALIGETSKDVRDVIVEGESGILAVHPKDFRPIYEPSKMRLTWPNGARATLYNGTEPDQMRGPQFDAAWIDELCKMRYARETWDMMQFALRLGDWPRVLVTTTPRPLRILKDILAEPTTVTVRGSTFENEANLSDNFIRYIRSRYEGTRLGRQELNGDILGEDPHALWRRQAIDDAKMRRDQQLPEMRRIVIAVDPASKAKRSQRGENGAETGIVACGLGVDDRGYVLGDHTVVGGPNDWGRAAVAAYHYHGADRIVAEINQGGDMVEHVIRSINPDVAFKSVTAIKGKVIRAEPVAALWEQGRISHWADCPELEDQMVVFNNLDTDADNTHLCDRVDALVWAISELFPRLVGKVESKWRDVYSDHQGGTSWMGR